MTQDEHGTGAHRPSGPEQEPAPPQEGEDQSSESVHEPAKLVRLASMIRQLLAEVRETELEPATRAHLRSRIDQTADEAGDVLSPDLRDELHRLRSRWDDTAEITQPELLVEQAQLMGWLEGVLQGIQTALSLEQASAQEELDHLGRPQHGSHR